MWLILYMRFDVRRSFAFRMVRGVGFTLIMMVPTTYQETTSYLAHGYGFILGLITALVLLPFISIRDLEQKRNSPRFSSYTPNTSL